LFWVAKCRRKVITERPPCSSYHRSVHPVDLVLGGHGGVGRKLEDLRGGGGFDHQSVSVTSDIGEGGEDAAGLPLQGLQLLWGHHLTTTRRQ